MRTSKRKRTVRAGAEARESQILSAAIELFSRYGFYETEIETVAKGAGVSKGTVYNYFRNKQALFTAAIEHGIARLSQRIAESTRGIDDPRARIEAAIDSYAAFIRDNRHLYRIVFLQRNTLRDAEEIRFAERFLAHYTLFERIIMDGIERKAFRNVNARAASFAIAGMILAVNRAQPAGGSGKAQTKLLAPIMHLILEGLGEIDSEARGASDSGPGAETIG